MRLGTALIDGRHRVVVRDAGDEASIGHEPGFADVALLDLLPLLLDPGRRSTLERAGRAPEAVTGPDARHVAPYRNPGKILGIGLNYREHARDLEATFPDEPVWFFKGTHTIIGPCEPIVLPPESQRVTAEAELGLVIGQRCHRVSTAEAMSYVAGVVPVLDQTAEDILARNARYLTWSKNYPTFFSFGPEIVTMDEVQATFPDLGDLAVSTVLNGEAVRTNTVSAMHFPPEVLVAFLSHIMPLDRGDIISTGTPGAVVIQPGDVVECRIPGIGTLSNPVASG